MFSQARLNRCREFLCSSHHHKAAVGTHDWQAPVTCQGLLTNVPHQVERATLCRSDSNLPVWKDIALSQAYHTRLEL